jgi:TPR repeat protein
MKSLLSLVFVTAVVRIASADGYPHGPGPCENVTACEKACKSGKTAMCAYGGVLALQDPLSYDRQVRGRAMLDKACAKGDAESCWFVARIADPGEGAPATERIKAVGDYERACNKQHARACFGLAAVLGLGEDEKSKKAAAAATKKAITLLDGRCTKNDAPACDWMARLYAYGPAVPPDETKANEYRERSCQIRTGAACPPPPAPTPQYNKHKRSPRRAPTTRRRSPTRATEATAARRNANRETRWRAMRHVSNIATLRLA